MSCRTAFSPSPSDDRSAPMTEGGQASVIVHAPVEALWAWSPTSPVPASGALKPQAACGWTGRRVPQSAPGSGARTAGVGPSGRRRAGSPWQNRGGSSPSSPGVPASRDLVAVPLRAGRRRRHARHRIVRVGEAPGSGEQLRHPGHDRREGSAGRPGGERTCQPGPAQGDRPRPDPVPVPASAPRRQPDEVCVLAVRGRPA